MQDAGPDATIDPLRQLEDKLDELLTGLREQTGQAQAQTLEHLACYSESLDELQAAVNQALYAQKLLEESSRRASKGLERVDLLASQLAGLKESVGQLEQAVASVLS
ncbi:hypothetical protein ACKKBG_A32845 [Auxenochlorella protothecoides x Auxenochlorella symbiontica]